LVQIGLPDGAAPAAPAPAKPSSKP